MKKKTKSTENQNKIIQNLSYYILFLISCIFTWVLVMPFFHIEIEEYKQESTIIGSSVYLLNLIQCGIFSYLIKEKKEFFGFGKTDELKRKLIKISISSFLFCFFIIIIKYLVISTVTLKKNYSLFAISELTSFGSFLSESALGILYCLFVPIQVFIFHSCIQSPLIKYLQVPKFHFTFSVLTTTILFSVTHIPYGVETVLIVLPVILFWCYNFEKDKCFWDIGSNIGLYSIYSALKYKNIKIYSFEPSSSNLRILSRNISINNLQDKIFINQFPLTDKDHGHQLMMESNFREGGALHSFGKNLNFEGKKMDINNNYVIYGFSINYLIKNLNYKVPNYLKIDVDGQEHFILKSADEILKNQNLKSILVEINENYIEQLKDIEMIMSKFNFKIIKKLQSKHVNLSETFKNTYNYIFSR